jgi:hypothetical protein
MRCFLLSFQQEVAQVGGAEDSSHSPGHRPPPNSKGAASQGPGTKTATAIELEASDEDATSLSFRAFPMNTQPREAFLLRYCESLDLTGSVPRPGTQSITNVRAESADLDPRRGGFGVFSPSSTTKYHTSGQKGLSHKLELGAQRPTQQRAGTPVQLGTQTFTKVHAEQADQDPRRAQYHAIPQCSSS